MKSYLLVVVLSIVGLSAQGHAGDFKTFINPGIKLGYTFGEHRGFTFGVECSMTRLVRDEYTYGVVGAIDFCRQLIRFHVGVEASRIVGVEWGPTIIKDGPGLELGHSLTPFLGFILYPYYTITFRAQAPDLHEYGSYLKVPVLAVGSDIHPMGY